MRSVGIILFNLILICGCSTNKKVVRLKAGYYETLKTTIIEKADLTNTLEIDSGDFTLLMYEYFSDVRFTNHSFHGKNIFLKVDSLEVFNTGTYFEIPSKEIEVKAFFSNYRCFVCKVDSIYGSIQKLSLNSDSVTLALDLKYVNKSESKQLLKDTITFSINRNLFDAFFVDHRGIYDNLRIALKEPLKVKKLELFSHKLTYGLDSLPDSFGEMRNLEELDLSNLSLHKLPQSFGNLTNLKTLDLSYNDFDEFPTQILALNNLEVLNLKLSHLDSIPPEIRQLKNLRIMILDDNRFSDFPIAITELNNLESLSITSSNISTIPSEIGNLKKLKELDLSSFWSYKRKNQVTDISNLIKLRTLEILNLDWNRIERLPENFCELKNLRKLSLLSNPIKVLPADIHSCDGLDSLIIDFENIDQNKESFRTKKGKVKVSQTNNY